MSQFQSTLICTDESPKDKGPCKRTQHVGTTLLNIVGIVLADVGFRVFKRSQLGNVAFTVICNTKGNLGLTFTQNSLRNCDVVTFVHHYAWRSMNTDDGKCKNASLLLLFSAILKYSRVYKQEQRTFISSEGRNVNENVTKQKI